MVVPSKAAFVSKSQISRLALVSRPKLSADACKQTRAVATARNPPATARRTFHGGDEAVTIIMVAATTVPEVMTTQTHLLLTT